MTRQDHQYVNLPRSLMEVVETCISNISSNGIQVYKTKKDFIIKAILQQIENEKSINQSLSRKIYALEKSLLQQQKDITLLEINNKNNRGGNRSKNV
jgi:hypothetical protein